VLFSPAGNLLALHGDGATIQLWDLSKPTKPVTQATLPGHPVRGVNGSVHALAFSPDGRLLASAGQDNKVVLWDVSAAKKSREWPLPEQVKSLAFAPDGRHLALGNADGSIFVLRLKNIARP
jgi:WD40 repeat protein